MKNKFSEKIIIFSWIIFLFLCLGLLSFTSHAASVSGPQFPILVEDQIDITPYQTYINNTYGGFWNLSKDNVIGWGSQESGYYIQTFAIPQVEDQVQNYLSFSPSGLVNSYPDFDYNNNTLTLTFSNLANTNNKPWRLISFYTNGNNGPGTPYSAAFNTASTLNKGVYGNTGAKLNYISSDIYLTNNGAWVVNMPIFVSEIPISPADIGTAILPSGLFTPDLSDIVPPSKVPPKYTPSDYTWTQKPSFDNSSTDALLRSIYGVIEWGMENIDGEFNTLKTNLDGWFKYLGDLLTYYLNGIVESINAGIQNFYENMANLIQPIFDKVDYITQPVSGSVIYDNISGTSIVSNINTIQTSLTSFQSSFTNVQEPESFKIPIHLENLPISYFGIQEVQYIDLGWLGSTEKGLIRTFMWAMVTYGLVITIFDSISNYINAGGDES